MAQIMAAFNLNGIDFKGISTDQSRLAALAQWLGEIVAEKPLVLTVASADASFRSYYRAQSPSRSYIVMDAPPPAEDTRSFHSLAQSLTVAGIAVPEVYGWAAEHGFMLLEDFGSTTLLASLGGRQDHEPLNGACKNEYESALDTLVEMQVRARPVALPKYDGAFLLKEMELFRRWLVHRHLSLSWSVEDEREWQRTTRQLVQDALAQPRVFVHRDYHSRNLMVRTASDIRTPEVRIPEVGIRQSTTDTLPLGVIDFQDAMHGPVFYDVVSLLKDCYVALSDTDLNHLLDHYCFRAKQAGLDVTNGEQEYRKFHAMGIQRHLKATGIFARLWHRDTKEGYLKDIPRTLHYIVDAGRNDVHYRWLSQWIEQRVLPQMSRIEISP